MRKIWIPLLTLLLAACNLPLSFPDFRSAPVTDTPTPPAGYTECAWNWATQSLPDLSDEVQSALEAAGLKGVTASAEAYGENCITKSGEVDHFATMETDFRVSLEVQDLADSVALGDLLERILVVLDAFPPDATPGPQPGYIGVRFIHGTEDINLWFNLTASKSARELGLHGADLFSELNK